MTARLFVCGGSAAAAEGVPAAAAAAAEGVGSEVPEKAGRG